MNKTKNNKKKTNIKKNTTKKNINTSKNQKNNITKTKEPQNKTKQEQKKVIKEKVVNTPKKNNLLDDKKYKEAEKLYKEKKYEESYDIYLKLNNKYPKNKKVYKRLIETLTNDYTKKDNSKDFKKLYDDYITTYKLLLNKKELKYFEKKLEEYNNLRKKSNSKFLLISLLGWFGVHKFIEKKYVIGVIYLLTLGIFGIGVIIDLINDYAEYEDVKQLNIVRYIISVLVLLFGIFKFESINIIFFIIVSILITPIVYSKLLRIIPNIIKIIVILILCYFGFKTTESITLLPTNILGTWKMNNENTNYKEITIHNNKSTIKFTDRKDEVGNNEYDTETKILKVYVNATTFYKFKKDDKENKLCIYNESDSCIIYFEK